MTIGMKQFQGERSIDIPKSSEGLALDAEYEKKGKEATPEKTLYMQKEAQKIFGSFQPDVVHDGQEEIQGIEKEGEINFSDTVKDSEHYPLLESLFQGGYISQDGFNVTVHELGRSSKSDEKEVIVNVLQSISNSDLRESLINDIEGNKEEITEETFESSEFYSHIQELDIDLDQGVGGLELMMANTFNSIPDKDGNTDINADIIRVMEKTTKLIIQKNNNDFRQRNSALILEISQATSISEKYLKLKSLYKEDLKTDAHFGGKRGKEEIAMKQKSLKRKAEKLALEMREMEVFASQNNEMNKQEQYKNQKELIIKEAQELDLFEGEIFVAGELDSLDEKLPQKNEQLS